MTVLVGLMGVWMNKKGYLLNQSLKAYFRYGQVDSDK